MNRRKAPWRSSSRLLQVQSGTLVGGFLVWLVLGDSASGNLTSQWVSAPDAAPRLVFPPYFPSHALGLHMESRTGVNLAAPFLSG